MNRIYVIEDQTVLRDLVCRLIGEMTMFELVGQSGDGLEGYKECVKLRPDVVIVDIMVPNLNGLEIVRLLKKEISNVKFLVFSAYSSRSHVQAAMKAGVHGIVHKNASIDELEKSIEKVGDGHSYMSSEILEIMRDLMLNPEHTDSLEHLTHREREILRLIAEGNTTKEIAEKLGVSVKTADTHRSNVMNKLDIHDVAGLTRFAIKQGLIEA